MKIIQKFVANDGAEFSDAYACETYEELCSQISTIMSRLPKRPENTNCSFENGKGYIQHTPGTFYGVREDILRLAMTQSSHKWLKESIENTDVHSSYAGRILDETSKPLSRAWYRIMCTDNKLREWGQPYYAANPDKAEGQFKLN